MSRTSRNPPSRSSPARLAPCSLQRRPPSLNFRWSGCYFLDSTIGPTCSDMAPFEVYCRWVMFGPSLPSPKIATKGKQKFSGAKRQTGGAEKFPILPTKHQPTNLEWDMGQELCANEGKKCPPQGGRSCPCWCQCGKQMVDLIRQSSGEATIVGSAGPQPTLEWLGRVGRRPSAITILLHEEPLPPPHAHGRGG